MGLYGKTYSLLFARFDAERCHDVALAALGPAGRSAALRRLMRARFCVRDPRLAVSTLGLDFPNPVGLAAGFDKDGVALPGLAALGFGHIEAGTVTPLSQPGNPKPRIFRLLEDKALINRMGFPNGGIDVLRHNLARDRARIGAPVGVSVGKGRPTPIERAEEDYRQCVSALYEYADYFALNISSPNTPGLRTLHDRALFERLARAAEDAGREAAQRLGCAPRPLLAKVSPDLDTAGLEQVIQGALDCGLQGLIATNTTLARDGLRSRRQSETGGLSGEPVKDVSTRMIREIHKRSGGKLVVVGCGGIFTADDAWEKLLAGASLVQAYTGFIYEGPGYARRINRGLLRLMDRNGLKSIGEAVGKG